MDEQIRYAEIAMTELIESVGNALPGMIAGFVVVAVTCGLAALVRKLARRLADRAETNRAPLLRLAGQTAFYVLTAIGLIMGAGTMGIDVSALVAGLGLTGFALGFALRDAVSNLIAGVLILLYRPFVYGDRIAVDNNEGAVIGINFRYTVLQAMDGNVVHVPNSTMFSSSVTVQAPATDAADPTTPTQGEKP